jgi:hypothetical protein
MPGGVHPPNSVIASWRSNYNNPESRGNGIVIAEITMLVCCYFIVGLRVWTRSFLSKSFGIDDVLICFNLVNGKFKSEASAKRLTIRVDSIDRISDLSLSR